MVRKTTSHQSKESLGEELRRQLTVVRALRLAQRDDPCPEDIARLKTWQASRLAHTHADLLANPRYRPAAQFFLEELYGPKDFSSRDDEVARVIPALVAMLPERALLTLIDAIRMDALSESLDTAMVATLRQAGHAKRIDESRYAAAYRSCGQRTRREEQLALVAAIGATLDRLTQMPLLRTSLRLMRQPAALAGLGNLHRFLNDGFSAFRHMRGADEFLATIISRERKLMEELFAERTARKEVG